MRQAERGVHRVLSRPPGSRARMQCCACRECAPDALMRWHLHASSSKRCAAHRTLIISFFANIVTQRQPPCNPPAPLAARVRPPRLSRHRGNILAVVSFRYDVESSLGGGCFFGEWGPLASNRPHRAPRISCHEGPGVRRPLLPGLGLLAPTTYLSPCRLRLPEQHQHA
jgi:hypothetical protein